MLTWEDDVEVHALRKRGWTIAAIARHTGFDRKTVRDYLSGKRTPGVRARPGPDPFDPFVDYVVARLTEDHTYGLARMPGRVQLDMAYTGRFHGVAPVPRQHRWGVGSPISFDTT